VSRQFRDRTAFQRGDRSYEFLPFRFEPFQDGVLLVNDVGEHLVLDTNVFRRLLNRELDAESTEYKDLKAKHFIWNGDTPSTLRILATKQRTRRSFLDGFVRLHIFVVSLRCEHSCHYCQVSRVTTNKSQFDMSVETADRALDLVFRSPAKTLKIEFQGGEPLLNFELIRHIVLRAEERAERVGKDIRFVVATNLALIDDDILGFLRDHGMFVSTSLDGPAFIHNKNRPRPENDSHQRAVDGIRRVRDFLGPDAVSALMTTSRLSLDHPIEIVDEYVKHGFDHIFLRPISPYGFAIRTQRHTGYEVDLFIEFYKKALDHIIDLNRQGRAMTEVYAQILLTKILTPFPTGYVDLQSPAGAATGVVVYNYDGDVYASDESRMLAEMGDQSLRLGNIHADSYEDLFGGELARRLVDESVVESLPGCSDCAFQPYCGADPVENYATQGSFEGHRPTSAFHRRNYALIKHLFGLYYSGDTFVQDLLWSWVQNRSPEDLLRRRTA